jgi:hypothetical protein
MAEMSQNLKDLVETKISFLASRLSTEDWAEMQAVFAGTAAAEDEVPDNGISLSDLEDRRGRPAAMDAKTAAVFETLYPGTKLPKGDTMGMRKPERMGRVTPKASESFHAIFPDAIATKHV